MYPDYPDLPGAAEEEGDTDDDDYGEGAQTPAPAQEATTAGQSCDAAKAPRGTKALRNQKDAVQRWKEAHAAAVSSRDAVQEDLADLLLDSMQAESLYRSWKTKFKATGFGKGATSTCLMERRCRCPTPPRIKPLIRKSTIRNPGWVSRLPEFVLSSRCRVEWYSIWGSAATQAKAKAS